MPSGVLARLADAYQKLGLIPELLSTVREAEEKNVWDITIYRVAAQALAKSKADADGLQLARRAASTAVTPQQKLDALDLVAGFEARIGSQQKAVEILHGLIKAMQLAPGLSSETLFHAEIERIAEKFSAKDSWESYWRQRQDFVYLHVIRRLIETVSPSARVVADIGSNRTPILDYFQGPNVRYSVDIENPYRGPGVIPICQDFYKWSPPEKVDVVTCFQVIEHVPDPAKFVRRLLEFGEVVLLLVPHMEPPGLNPGHINNDIDLDLIVVWAGRTPNFHYIARELSGDERIICLFDNTTSKPMPQLHREHPDAIALRHRWGQQNIVKARVGDEHFNNVTK